LRPFHTRQAWKPPPTYGNHLRWGGFHVRHPSAYAKHRNHPRWGGFRVRCLFAHPERDVGCIFLLPSKKTTPMWVVFVFDAFPHTRSTENAEHENHPNTGGFRVRHPSSAEQKITYVFVLINVTSIVIVNKIFLLCHPREL
jgi:hypothetical protein